MKAALAILGVILILVPSILWVVLWDLDFTSDHALVGLMARDFLLNPRPLFQIWGSDYQGLLLSVPWMSLFLAVFGDSPTSLHLSEWVVFVGFLAALGLYFSKEFSKIWIWIFLFVLAYWSPFLYAKCLRTMPNYTWTFTVGMLFLWALRERRPFLIGALAAYGWYLNGQIAYFLAAGVLGDSQLVKNLTAPQSWAASLRKFGWRIFLGSWVGGLPILLSQVGVLRAWENAPPIVNRLHRSLNFDLDRIQLAFQFIDFEMARFIPGPSWLGWIWIGLTLGLGSLAKNRTPFFLGLVTLGLYLIAEQTRDVNTVRYLLPLIITLAWGFVIALRYLVTLRSNRPLALVVFGAVVLLWTVPRLSTWTYAIARSDRGLLLERISLELDRRSVTSGHSQYWLAYLMEFYSHGKYHLIPFPSNYRSREFRPKLGEQWVWIGPVMSAWTNGSRPVDEIVIPGELTRSGYFHQDIWQEREVARRGIHLSFWMADR